ncbi:uncharacterized protein LOC135830795 [Sycon ciliatum]|uniref:uncharacterized protein LOC135830795 n=1 Tax=Sycon ciliatum TaxID=27933 RepID=UPI0031F62F52
MKLESAPGAGPILQPRTSIPFPNISFYSRCTFVQIDITAEEIGQSCNPTLVLLKEFPGGKYQIASERIPPSTHITGIATWTGVSLDHYVSHNSRVTEAFIIGMTLQVGCQLNSKATSPEVAWVMLQGSTPDVLQKFSYGAALEPPVTMTIRASSACNQATCDSCQTLYQSCPALGATGKTPYQYYCGTASNYTCPTTTAVQPTTRSTTSPLTKTSIVPQVATSATPSTTSTRSSSSAVTNLRTNTFEYRSDSETSTEVLVSGSSQHASSPPPGSSKRGSPSATEAVDRVIILPGTGQSSGLTMAFNIPLLLLTLSILLVLLYRMKRESLSARGHSRQEKREAVGLQTPTLPPSAPARPEQCRQVATDTSEGPYYIDAVDLMSANVTPKSCFMTDGTMSEFVHAQSSTAPANSEETQDSLCADLETTENASTDAQERPHTLLSKRTRAHRNPYEGLGPHSRDLASGESLVDA